MYSRPFWDKGNNEFVYLTTWGYIGKRFQNEHMHTHRIIAL